ncbi:TPA: hypothetical protein MYJ90_001699 [Klebsiella pneumoniae]|nr:hypothetical protein [Klebsiella pneumoniae]
MYYYTYHTILELNGEMLHYFGKHKTVTLSNTYHGSGRIFDVDGVNVVETIIVEFANSSTENSRNEEKLIACGKAQFGDKCVNIHLHSIDYEHDMDVKESISSAIKEIWRDKEFKSAVSAKHKENWSNDEYKERMMKYRDYSKVSRTLKKRYEETAKERELIKETKRVERLKKKEEQKLTKQKIREIKEFKSTRLISDFLS